MRGYGFHRVGGPEQQGVVDVAEPDPSAGELLVEVRAAGVNPGDWRVRNGSYGVAGPAVLGREVAGTVLALGEGVTGFDVGDEVFGGCPGMLGGWAPRALVTASFTAHRPDGVTPEQAAVLPVAAGTAHDFLNDVDLPSGATLLVNGAGGGVGIPLVQLARARGLRVVGTASPAKHALLTELGATPVSYGDGVTDRIRAAAPHGVDGALDLVGGDALRTIAGLVPRGTLFSIADKPLAAELGGRDVTRDRSTAVLASLAGLVADGSLDPLVRVVLPLDDAGEALGLVEGGHVTGKVVLVP
ncbi:NADP-dependent oxidoreductase [Pseudonocardia phyllosphaerae]|uniref:NADP-dependent oxidoreductase n=1 Tax=Pseudonocardia phyllosphaerae TaxID=3390502 RepID=UPI003979A50C